MRYAAHHEFVRQIVKSVQVLQNEPELPHEGGVFEVLLQVGIELRYKKRIIIWQCGNKGWINGDVVFSGMARSASSPVSVKGFVKKKIPSLGN